MIGTSLYKFTTWLMLDIKTEEEVLVDIGFYFHKQQHPTWGYYGGEPGEPAHIDIEYVQLKNGEYIDITEEQNEYLIEKAWEYLENE